MDAVRAISRLFVSLLDTMNRGTGWMNRLRMARWAAEVERIVRSPPGSDDGFTAEQIETYGRSDFSKFSTWSIVCEEVLDTTFPCAYFESARRELRRRGIADDEYAELRRFAWLTAGWLNYEKMLWDWHNLDEHDLQRAIEWQFSEGWIARDERDRRLAFVAKYNVSAGEGTADER
jgi:hypothetical protein